MVRPVDGAGFGKQHRHHVLAGFRPQLVGPDFQHGLPVRVRLGACFARHDVSRVPFDGRQTHGDQGAVDGSAPLIRETGGDLDCGYVAHGFLIPP